MSYELTTPVTRLNNLDQQQSPRLQMRFNKDTDTKLTEQMHKPHSFTQSVPTKELSVYLQNLYINPKKYRPEYNFYNYNRFKQTQIIPIIYKTPSIFLNGLHFELPIADIIGVSKSSDTQIIRLSVNISRQDFQSAIGFDDILEVFRKIEEYNTDFFDKHASKMEIKIRKTLKNTNSNGQLLQSQSSFQVDDMLINRFKPQGSRKLEYRPFFEINSDTDADCDNINISLEIKQQYLAKIIQSQYLTLTSRHITNQAEITEPLRQYMQQIEALSDTLNLEFFELKKKEIDINLAVRPISIRLWIKCNMFGMDTAKNQIAMRWKVCYYEC